MLANECSVDALVDRSNGIFHAKLNVDTNITYLHKLHVIWSVRVTNYLRTIRRVKFALNNRQTVAEFNI